MRRRILIGVVVAGCILTLVGFSAVLRSPFTEGPATPRAEYWEGLFMQIFWVAMVVGILVWGLLIYALFRFRAKPGGPKEGPHIHGNTKMEIAWTIAPALVMGWLLVVSFNGLFSIEGDPPQIDSTIEITAFQFGWKFQYEDGVERLADNEAIWIEQNKFTKFVIRSDDVIHAFSVPELNIMKDAVPGRTNYDWVQPTRVGNYTVKCRELCGIGHSRMLATIAVFPEGAHGGRAYGPADFAEATTSPTGSPTNTTTPTNATSPTANVSIPADAQVVNVTLAPESAYAMAPANLEVPLGPVVFQIFNDAPGVPHNMYIGTYVQGQPDNGAQWKSVTINGGETTHLPVEFTQDMTYEFWCNIGGHRTGYLQGMSGVLTVGEGGGAPPGGGPLLPGFEAFALLFAASAIALALRRRA